MIKKHIPNSITCLNLLSGALAVIYCLHEGRLDVAGWLIVLAAVFDFFDGMVARLLGVSSPIGKDLDSLADVLSFGLAPAVIMVHALWQVGVGFYEGLVPLLIAAFAALRLAKFNNDTRQSTSFIGLPVPANALFWIGLQSILPELKVLLGGSALLVVVYALVGLMCYLMVSELPMFSFKFKAGQGIKDMLPQLVLVAVVVVSALCFGVFACSISIVAYILLSLFGVAGKARGGQC